MSATKAWQAVLEVDGLRCPVALRWLLNKGVLKITMNGDWYAHVDLEDMYYMDAAAVKRGLDKMFQPAEKAKMPEPLRGLQPVLEAMIDEWFANQPVSKQTTS